MKGIVIYKSKYGSTKKYAEWIRESTGFDMAEADKFRPDELGKYDTVIFGGGIYAGGIAGIAFLKKNIARLHGKNLAVFCCGASPYDADFMKALKERNMPGEMSDIPLFYCRGGCDIANLHFADKTLCKMLVKAVAKKDPAQREVWETALVEASETACDWTDKAYITPILETCGIA
ncbi:MAG: flavodoxin [Clostridiales bacterium]|nr:flavodoxin [Clostridiales bacterium]